MAAKFAQHFLINLHACERIVASLDLSTDDVVIEIGPGKGALTALILKQAKQVVAIEIDPDLVKLLRSKYERSKNFHLVHQDIMEFNFVDFFKTQSPGRRKILGNLPYNLTSPILRKICDWDGWSEAVIMVQKEVGDRLTATVATPAYGALTVGMNLTCEIKPIFILSASSFKPPPRVQSSVVRLIRRQTPLTENVPRTQRVIQAAFQQRRKTILNSLSHGFNLPKETTQKILTALSIDPGKRPETISIPDFIRLSQALSSVIDYNPKP